MKKMILVLWSLTCGIIPVTVFSMQSKVESILQECKGTNFVFKLGGNAIATLPVEVATMLSPVFKAQASLVNDVDRFHIDLYDLEPLTVQLFVDLANLYYEYTQQPDKATLYRNVYNLIQQKKSLLLELYHFCDVYAIKDLLPFIAQPLINQIAQEPKIYNHKNIPFFDNDTLNVLSTSLCYSQQNIPIFVQKSSSMVSHNGMIPSITLSSNGKYVATASVDNTSQIYDMYAQQVIATITHANWVYSVAFSHDSRFVVTASKDGTACIYDLHEKKIFDILHHSDWVYTAVFSPDGKYVATGSKDKTMRLYDMQHKKFTMQEHHSDWVTAVAFSSDGLYLATPEFLYSVEKKEKINTFEQSAQVASAVVFSPNTKYIALAFISGDIRFYRVDTKDLAPVLHNNGGVSALAFSPNSVYLSIVTADNSSKIYNIETNEFIATFNHASLPYYACFSPDSNYVVIAAGQDQAIVYDITLKKIIQHLNFNQVVTAAKFSPSGRELFVAADNVVYLQPLTLCGMPSNEVVGIATVVAQAKLKHAGQSILPLQQSGWLYKQLINLSQEQKSRLYFQYPSLEEIVNNALALEQVQQKSSIDKKSSRETDGLAKKHQGKRQKKQ